MVEDEGGGVGRGGREGGVEGGGETELGGSGCQGGGEDCTGGIAASIWLGQHSCPRPEFRVPGPGEGVGGGRTWNMSVPLSCVYSTTTVCARDSV